MKQRWISLEDLGREPFRLFFPQGVVAGVAGVAMWPLYFAAATGVYPGTSHARLMAFGLFGGFIFGFLGTALPRILSVRPLGTRITFLLVTLHFGALAAFATQTIWLGDSLFLALLGTFGVVMTWRARERRDIPPPGFVLVGLGFLSALTGTAMTVVQPLVGDAPGGWTVLGRLLSYQGFVLLPILGVGPFLLPRFLGLSTDHDFPKARKPSGAWQKKAALALGTGALVVASFFMEVEGWLRTGHAVRFGVILIYVVIEFPLHRPPKVRNALVICLRLAFVSLLAGIVSISLFPTYRVSLLHVTLIGGLAVTTFTVATRVVFGHSGNLEKLNQRNRWLLIAVALMLLAMATRVSGDFWPRITASHYIYGALVWIAGVLIWSWHVLPKVLQTEDE